MVIIGDVHGYLKTLHALLAQLPPDEKIAFCGDLIDRGPDSKGVVQLVIDRGYDCVMGNHERMMLEEGYQRRFSGIWLRNGGEQTLDSYCNPIDGKLDEETFKKHMAWMEELPVILAYPECKNEEGRMLVVSHSSCGKVWKWDDARREQMSELFENTVMWGREPPKAVKEIYNVFGHTPQKDEPRIRKPFANIDTGCFYTVQPGYGVLTALQFPQMKVYQQKNIG